jgi:hypothetical protein
VVLPGLALEGPGRAALLLLPLLLLLLLALPQTWARHQTVVRVPA